MSILTERGIGNAIQEFIEKDEKDAILNLINYQIEKTQGFLKKTKWRNDNQLSDEIKKFHDMRISAQKEEENEIKELFDQNRTTNKPSTQPGNTSDAELDEIDTAPTKSLLTKKKPTQPKANVLDDFENELDEGMTSTLKKAPAKRGRGSRGGSTSTTRGRGRGKGAASATSTQCGTQIQISFSGQLTTSSRKPTQKSYADVNLDDSEIVDMTNDDFKLKPSNQTRKPAAVSSQSAKSQLMYDDEDQSDSENRVKSKISLDDDDDSNIFRKTETKRRRF